MAQRKPEEKATLDQVLKLADQLTPEEQDELMEELKLQWLRRAIGEAEKSVAEGRVHSLEEVEARLDATRREILEIKNKK
ncbi:hypothetical protein BH10CYA1_BH10CYA1_03900 [soil metagenome]